jgi:PAS domain S-box-containing protein
MPPSAGQPALEPLAFAAGGGEMGGRLRAFDWSATPLGPPQQWPRALVTAVQIMLGSRYPMFLWWGPELIKLYNDAYIPMLGKRHPGALGRPAAEVWSDVWSIVGPQAEIVLKQGAATWNQELLLVVERNDFVEEAYFTFSYSPAPDDDGAVGGVFCAVSEDTLRVIGQRRLRTLRALAERSSEARTPEAACAIAAETLDDNVYDVPFALLYLIDGDARRAVLAGSTRLDPGAMASPPIIALDDRGAVWPLREALEKGATVEVEGLRGRVGSLPGGAWPETPQRAVVVPIAKPTVSKYFGLLVLGLSPRLAYDDDYAGFVELLAGHVATAISRATAFEDEKRRAESLAELDRAKTAFFSNVSHEFRTPLTLMLGPVEDLLTDPAALLPPARRTLEVANRNGRRLLRLVNTLLDFSRIEAGRVRAAYQPIDLAAYTSDLASNFRSACERAGLRLVVDCDAIAQPVFVDREMWEKIVLNLLSNALKFTLEGEITVALRQIGDTAELEIRDTGTGIPAGEIAHLFERFHRVANAVGRTHEGSGIGLALVYELVKLHGGSIGAESEVGKGTKFKVSIPLGSAHLPPEQIADAAVSLPIPAGASPFVEEALRWLPDSGEDVAPIAEAIALFAAPDPPGDREDRPLVLVADDNADMRQYVCRLLEPRFRVVALGDGAAALAAARELAPDLVVADVMMPRLDGFGLLRAMREDPLLGGIPVVLLSARAGEEARIEGLQAGADDYLTKPFSARELVARIDANVKLAALRRQTEGALSESEQRLRLATDAGQIGIAVWDVAADRVAGNEWLARILGLDAAEVAAGITSQRFTRLVHKDDRPRVVEAITRVIEAGGSYDFECRIARPDGVRWVHVRGRSESGPDGPARLANTLIDITGRKEIERTLRQADRRKDEFLAILAHELRNPLATIRNAVAIFEHVQGDPGGFERTHAMMDRQVAQMVRLVEDLLDVSRIGRGTLELRRDRVELAAIVHEAVDSCRALADAAGHELSVVLPSEPVMLDADPVRLVQVFANLLNNACKFTETGGRIQLTAERAGDEVIVVVQDNGVGIPAEEVDRIFELFEQVEKTLEHSQTGLGIGLSLVKRLVELHDGTISAHSDGPDRGSRFVVRLPVVD